MKSISAGGVVLGALPGALVGVGASVINPWFLDCPAVWLLGFVLLPGVVFGWVFRGRWSRSRWAFVLLAAEVLGVVWMGWRPRPVVEGVKLLVIGLDGATDQIVEPMIARGEAPGLERVRSGARGVLRSMDPMFSPILWTTMATGRLPQDHGVEGFRVSSQDVRVPRFWDVAEAEGWTIGTWKWLVTYPPRQVRGFQVPAWLASGDETWPEHLGFTKQLELSNRIQRQRVEASSSLVSLAITGVQYGVRAQTLLMALGWKVSERFFDVDRLARRARLEPLRVRLDRDAFVHATWKHTPELATFTVYSI
ncbi:MAG: alkaline phosphatase family protein, partial [Myxococcota bacterium]|nr:alkaline phosphatase family protein [Myxococcota bacterium]